MPTIKLTPSTYYLSNSSYLSVSNASNMYDDTDSTNYATVYNSRTSTTSYYIYLRGFDFSQVPEGAIVSDFTVRLKAYESGVSTSTSYQPYLANGTSAINGSCTPITTSASVHEFTGISADWETISDYGSNFGIRINCRRASRNTEGYVYIYGAEIEVTYSNPVYYDVTLTNPTSTTVTVSDAHPLEGSNVTVTADSLDGIAVTDNGTDVTSQFVYGLAASVSAVPEQGVSTQFSDSDADFYMSSSSTGTDYFEYACGHSAEDPGYTGESNTYVKDGYNNTATGTVIFSFDFSDIPVGASINSVEVRCYGARESSTMDSTHMAQIALYSGTTQKGSSQDFTSTSNSIVTLSDVGSWTRDELQNATLHFTVAYYGGRIYGVTWEVEYEADGYVYTITNITADHVIAVESTMGPGLYVKRNGSWTAVSSAYRKVSGSWAQVELDQVFQSGVNYVCGD